MKTLIFFILSFIVIECSGQQKPQSYLDEMRKTAVFNKGGNCVCGIKPVTHAHQLGTISPTIISSGQKYLGSENIGVMWVYKNDTLEIKALDKIHFIKIGDRLYKIESPTLTEIKKYAVFELHRNTSPNYYLAKPYYGIDTTSFLDKYFHNH